VFIRTLYENITHDSKLISGVISGSDVCISEIQTLPPTPPKETLIYTHPNSKNPFQINDFSISFRNEIFRIYDPEDLRIKSVGRKTAFKILFGGAKRRACNIC
jgi:hypothetical protein